MSCLAEHNFLPFITTWNKNPLPRLSFLNLQINKIFSVRSPSERCSVKDGDLKLSILFVSAASCIFTHRIVRKLQGVSRVQCRLGRKDREELREKWARCAQRKGRSCLPHISPSSLHMAGERSWTLIWFPFL